MPDRALTIGDRTVSDNSDPYLIAEIGHNHQGDVGKAEWLVRMAAKVGASAVKFQKRDNKTLYTKKMYSQPYIGRNSFGPTYGLHREALELGRPEYERLAKVAADVGVDLLATPFDVPSVDFVTHLGVPAIKIASADVTNLPLLKYAAGIGKPLILSTGAASLTDVQRACAAILPINGELAVLQCTAAYPAPPEVLNLGVITAYREQFPGLVIGYSGHAIGIEAALIAYSLGARIIESHFTLDRTALGTDHAFSLEPEDLARLVDGLRRVRAMLGSPLKRKLAVEEEALRKMGKKLVAAREMPAGHVLTATDVAVKSPGDGLPPYWLPEVVGRALVTPLLADEEITFGVLRPR